MGCTIHERRSSTCREFDLGGPGCDEARQRHGLAPLAARELAWGETAA